MKKNLFLIALIASTVCFVGCGKDNNDPDPNPGSDVKVTVNPHEVTLTVEEPSVRLSATLDPADPTATIVWSSSDTTVAAVNSRGYVEATGYGDCYIYAAVGESKDSCHILVKSYLESILFTGAIVWEEDTTFAQNPKTGEFVVDTIEASDGSQYYAYKALATLFVFSDGFYVNSSGRLDGTEKGTILEIQAPMYYATAYLNNTDKGTIFCLGEWGVTDNIQYMKEGEPGKISDEAEYLKQMKLFLEEYNAGGEGYGQYLKAAGELFEGATLGINEYDAEGEGYYSSYIPDAVCNEATMSLNGDFPASPYMCGMDYCIAKFTPLAYDWGMHLEEVSPKQLALVDEEIHWDEPIISSYGEVPADGNQVQAMKPLHLPVISEDPVLKASLEKQFSEKSIKVLRMKH